MAFDVPDGVGLHVRDGHRLDGCPGLAGSRRGGIAQLLTAVVVDRGPLDDGVHVVTVRPGRGERLEQHGADAAAEQRAAGSLIERATVPVGRVDGARLRQIAADVGDADDRGARKRHVRLAVAQGPARQVHRQERRRAGALHVDAGAGQVQLERHARAEEIAVIADMPEVAGLAAQVRMGEADHVAGDEPSRAGVHAHDAVGAERVVAGVLERLPRDFEEQAMLGVHQAGFARARIRRTPRRSRRAPRGSGRP